MSNSMERLLPKIYARAELSCELCGKNKKRIDSHIIPRFIKRYLFNDIGKGKNFFFVRNLRKPEQDVLKPPFLCDVCEGNFSGLERHYAIEHFHPYNKDTSHCLIFDEEIYKFLVSLAWRALRVILINQEFFRLPEETVAAEESMRNYLLGKAPTSGSVRIFLILGRDIDKQLAPDKLDSVFQHQSILFKLYNIPLIDIPDFDFPSPPRKHGVKVKYGAHYLFCETYYFDRAIAAFSEDLSNKLNWDGIEVTPVPFSRDQSLPVPQDAMVELIRDYQELVELFRVNKEEKFLRR